MNRLRTQSWSKVVLFPLALASLGLIFWVAWQFMHLPYTGATWALRSGTVEFVDHAGPAAGRLQPGDRILTINGTPALETRRLPMWQAGESLHLVVERSGTLHSVLVHLIEPPPTVLLRDLLPLLIALAFWALSLVVLGFAPIGTQTWLAFLFTQAMSATLASGAVSWVGPLWTAWLFDMLVWWFGPLAILFHLHFPARASRGTTRHLVLALFGVAILGSLPELVVDPVTLRDQVPVSS